MTTARHLEQPNVATSQGLWMNSPTSDIRSSAVSELFRAAAISEGGIEERIAGSAEAGTEGGAEAGTEASVVAGTEERAAGDPVGAEGSAEARAAGSASVGWRLRAPSLFSLGEPKKAMNERARRASKAP